MNEKVIEILRKIQEICKNHHSVEDCKKCPFDFIKIDCKIQTLTEAFFDIPQNWDIETIESGFKEIDRIIQGDK